MTDAEKITIEEPTAERDSLLITFPYSLTLDMGAYHEVAELSVEAECQHPSESPWIVSIRDIEDGCEIDITEVSKEQKAELLTEAVAIIAEHLKSLADYNAG